MCPSCQNLFTERNTVKDIRTDREVEELIIKCSNRTDRCKWVGELKFLDNHKENCNSESVPCTNSCGNAIQRQKLTDHLQKKCPKRNHQCPHCKREGKYRDITGPHLRVCNEMKIHCSICQKNVKCCMMDAHQISCMAEPVPCQYQSVGCNARPSRQNISQHNLEAMGDHLRLAVEAIAQQHTEIVQLRREQLEMKKDIYLTGAMAPVILKMENVSKLSKLKTTRRRTWHSGTFYTNTTVGYKARL